VGGYAWYNSSSVVMKLPRYKVESLINYHTKEKTTSITVASAHRVAQVYIHEVGHNLGLHHRDMQSSCIIDVSWWPNEDIPIRQMIVKSKPNIIEVRAAKAQKKLDEWLKKSKRAKTLVKKYAAKVKYYEKKRAASK